MKKMQKNKKKPKLNDLADISADIGDILVGGGGFLIASCKSEESASSLGFVL